MEIYLQSSPSVELAHALHSLLSVHHGGHCRPLLKGKVYTLKYQSVHDWKCHDRKCVGFKILRDSVVNCDPKRQ